MKKFYKLLGIIAIGAVIATGMTGCDTDSGLDSNDYQQGNNTGGNNTWDNNGGDNTGGNNTWDNNGGDNTGGNNTWDNNGGDNTGGNNTWDNNGGDNNGGNNTWDNNGGDNNGGNNTGGGTTTTEYRIDQAIFGSCSKSGNNLVFNWKLTTSGKTPNGLYTYTSPSNIVVSVQEDGSYYDLETLAGSARTYTFKNFAAWAADDRVYFRVKCVSNYNETISYNVYRVSANTFTPNYSR